MASEPIHIGMKPPHPGEFIREEVLEELGLSVTFAAEVLKVRRATLSDLLNEKAGLTPEMALRLEAAFGLDMEGMLQMQVWHDVHTARAQAGDLGIVRYEPGH
ncbi:MAG: HigA family addiction module antitoxin [Pseudomonadota bacterium]